MARNQHRCRRTCVICGESYTCTTLGVRWISKIDGSALLASDVWRARRDRHEMIDAVRTDVHMVAHVRAGVVKPDDYRIRWH